MLRKLADKCLGFRTLAIIVVKNSRSVLRAYIVALTTGATSFHASAKIQRKSKMEYVNDVAGGMGDIWESDEGKVLQLADVLESL